jgi:hypothetical protein
VTRRSMPFSQTVKSDSRMPPIARPLRSVTLALKRINCGATAVTSRQEQSRLSRSDGSFSGGGSVLA